MAILVYSTMRDHPRVCGEHLPERYPWMLCRGSSPRMRGTHSRRLQRRHPQGIIPAHAGNTPHTTCSWSRNWDHPRVCGEHTCNAPMMHNAMGSSPRMRGTRHGRGVDAALPGIIPAYAGNTFEGVGPCVFCGDHPRVCGEHMSNFTYWKLHEGSSPRMRGTHTGVAQAGQQSGIIPAYAGNTGCMRPVFSIHKDHPRVCGEHMLRERRIVWQAGSSPRMRGTRFIKNAGACATGIIPAYAGNTIA